MTRTVNPIAFCSGKRMSGHTISRAVLKHKSSQIFSQIGPFLFFVCSIAYCGYVSGQTLKVQSVLKVFKNRTSSKSKTKTKSGRSQLKHAVYLIAMSRVFKTTAQEQSINQFTVVDARSNFGRTLITVFVRRGRSQIIRTII